MHTLRAVGREASALHRQRVARMLLASARAHRYVPLSRPTPHSFGGWIAASSDRRGRGDAMAISDRQWHDGKAQELADCASTTTERMFPPLNDQRRRCVALFAAGSATTSTPPTHATHRCGQTIGRQHSTVITTRTNHSPITTRPHGLFATATNIDDVTIQPRHGTYTPIPLCIPSPSMK